MTPGTSAMLSEDQHSDCEGGDGTGEHLRKKEGSAWGGLELVGPGPCGEGVRHVI